MRPAHAALDGVTLPPSDPFWLDYFPPNGWNCRCTVVQVRKSKYPATPREDALDRARQATADDRRGIFRFNPGAQQKTFPDYNPYTISRCRDCDIAKGNLSLAHIPENEFCSACPLIRECEKERQEKYAEYQRYLNDPDYKDVQFDERTGGLKATHIGHNEHHENDRTRYFGNLTKEDLENECQDWLFKWGHKAILRNEQKLQPDGNPASSLDLELDGEIMDIASITEFNGMYGYRFMNKNNQIYRAREQSGDISDSLCLYFHDPSMFHEEQLIHDMQWYKDYAPTCGSEQRIHHLYVVVRGENDVRKYEI